MVERPPNRRQKGETRGRGVVRTIPEVPKSFTRWGKEGSRRSGGRGSTGEPRRKGWTSSSTSPSGLLYPGTSSRPPNTSPQSIPEQGRGPWDCGVPRRVGLEWKFFVDSSTEPHASQTVLLYIELNFHFNTFRV